MNNSQAHTLAHTISTLSSFNYPDAYRIAKEICEFTDYNADEISKVIEKLQNNMPWEYVRGWAEFRGLKYFVNSTTLIPRIETEQLIDLVSQSITPDISQIVDVGTGSGIISIALKKALPKIDIIAVDISDGALEIAKENAKGHGVDIDFKLSNLLENVSISKPTIIVANLPYIPHSDYLTLDPSVKDYEPLSALDGGELGLDYIYQLIDQCSDNENVKAIWLEIDPSQAELIEKKYPNYTVTAYKDFRGLVRFLKLNS